MLDRFALMSWIRSLQRLQAMTGNLSIPGGCEGGGSAAVRQEVTRLVAAALGITANKIWVARMQT